MSVGQELAEAMERQTRELAVALGDMPDNGGNIQTDGSEGRGAKMASLEYSITVPRRQAMLCVAKDYGGVATSTKLVPVLVWPMPTLEGDFIAEHHDGSCTYENAENLTFLDSDELFDKYDWS